MIGYFGSVTFQTSDKRICTFRNLKRAASSSFSDHKRYRKKSEREFEGPESDRVFRNAIYCGPWREAMAHATDDHQDL